MHPDDVNNQAYFPAVFDSSMLASYKACQQLFFKTYIQEYKPKGLSVHLHAGKCFATGVEVARTRFFCEGQSAADSVADGLRALLTAYGDFDCPSDSAKSAERTAGALEFYFDRYPLEDSPEPVQLPGGKRGIEFSFAHPLPLKHPLTGDPLLYCGRMDAILAFPDGPRITDEKTTSSLGQSWANQWDLRAQFMGYAWGCQQAGIPVVGAMVRGVSILKTKYDTQQAPLFFGEWKIARWYDEMLCHVEEIIDRWRKGRWLHNFDHECASFGGCAFRHACDSKDSSFGLDTLFERRHWNPITREETLL